MSNALHVLLASAAALTAPLVSIAPAQAASTPIAGPGSYGVGATTSAEEPDLAGVVLEDRLQPFTINGAAGGVVSGTIQERVVRSNDTGFLHFYHRVILDEISGFDIGSYLEWLELDPLATGDPLAVGRRPDGAGSATSSSYDLAGTGQSRFDFNLLDLDPPNAGFGTQFHYLKTNATNYALTGQLRLSGFEFIGFDAEAISTAWLPTWAPAAVPEPESWAIMVAGFGILGAALRRRRTSGYVRG
ncbi:MAG: PEP-CTERM sorting domain-containing protein [Phenylobacterium sp.]|uniref:PEPxxWA-CTERM sorting domain-containing protein n=1 Tax=Phenylobacterium sp. TaxID=1871053 RepID=UPI001208DAB7|nr:PEPxxWA-CTERM sorting domain-containing protein [Phenylobacterium sp.]TAJ69617.1 MAG: PEP-CTERM sorting domain-containing protein [Phenylobacterium sp.]